MSESPQGRLQHRYLPASVTDSTGKIAETKEPFSITMDHLPADKFFRIQENVINDGTSLI